MAKIPKPAPKPDPADLSTASPRSKPASPKLSLGAFLCIILVAMAGLSQLGSNKTSPTVAPTKPVPAHSGDSQTVSDANVPAPLSAEQRPVADAQRGRFNPNAMRDPGEVCSAPFRIGLPADRTWRVSVSTAGGYICDNLGSAALFGATGPNGMATNVSYFVYGSGARKLDQAILKLNINNLKTAEEGKRQLVNGSRLLASTLGFELPPGAVNAINLYKASMTAVPPKALGRSLFTSPQGKIVLEVSVEQTRLTSILVSFKNVDASKIWQD